LKDWPTAGDEEAVAADELERLRAVERAARALVDSSPQHWGKAAVRALVDLRAAVAGAPDDGDETCSRADIDPIEAALSLIRGSRAGYQGIRGRIGRALIAVLREHEREWEKLALAGGLDERTLRAARDMRDAEACSLIGAIGGAL
jgi:hypothetical protein